MKLQKKLTILIDTREKQPLTFSRFHTTLKGARSGKLQTLLKTSVESVEISVEKKQMATADYALKGFEDCCLIERKQNLFELFGNVITVPGRRRFKDELIRLNNECRTPFLLLEGVPTVLTGAAPIPHKSGLSVQDLIKARDSMLDLLMTHKVSYAILPASTLAQRRAVSEWAIAILIAGANHDNFDPFSTPHAD